MSTDNRVRVEIQTVREFSISNNDPALAAREALRLVEAELGAFTGRIEVEWTADSNGQAGARLFENLDEVRHAAPSFQISGPGQANSFSGISQLLAPFAQRGRERGRRRR